MSEGSGSQVYKGGCLCGAVRFEVTAAPAMTGFCYCLSCRKSSGAGHTFHAIVPQAALKISGEVRGYDWRADSGGNVTTSFCPTCGSQLFGKSSAMGDMITFRVAALDDPSSIKPQMSIYTKRLLPWDHLDTALPGFSAMPPMPAQSNPCPSEQGVAS